MITLYDDFLRERITALRNDKSVSAREMSLSLGLNECYINNIETGKALPSMENFFYICEYLNITPKEFFDTDVSSPKLLNKLVEDLKKLDRKQLDTITNMVNTLLGK